MEEAIVGKSGEAIFGVCGTPMEEISRGRQKKRRLDMLETPKKRGGVYPRGGGGTLETRRRRYSELQLGAKALRPPGPIPGGN